MELFGIADGKIVLSSGSEPTPKQVDMIMKACSLNVAAFVYQKTVNNGEKALLQVPAAKSSMMPLADRKKAFLGMLEIYQRDNFDKYPFPHYNNFYSWWTEIITSKLVRGKIVQLTEPLMRFEVETAFEIPKRLKYSWGKKEKSVQSAMWAQHYIKYPTTQISTGL